MLLFKSLPNSPALIKLSRVEREPISPSAIRYAPTAIQTSTNIVSNILDLAPPLARLGFSIPTLKETSYADGTSPVEINNLESLASHSETPDDNWSYWDIVQVVSSSQIVA